MNLPVKYAFSGHIDPFEKVGQGFYDMGSLAIGENIPMLGDLTWEKRDPQRKVLFLNWEAAVADKIALKNNVCKSKSRIISY
jgi:hypothetical protein